MNKQKNIIVDKFYDITPVSIRFVGPVFDYRWHTKQPVIDSYQINVNFKGNIMPLVLDADLSKEYGLLPKHADIIFRGYSENNDITHIRYNFKCGLFGMGQKRARAFEKEIRAQMINPTNPKDMGNVMVPCGVSFPPVKYNDSKNKGYKVSVKYDGVWDRYPPVILSQYKYHPRGATIIGFDYDNTNHLTNVDYVFKSSRRGESRAWDFVNNIQNQIDINNKAKQYVGQFYKPFAVGKYSVSYDDHGIFEKLTLPVDFGDVYKQTVKKLPEPEYENVRLDVKDTNFDYKVYYNFYGESFKEAFVNMNKFKAKMLATMTKRKVK